jgi:AcrR family transcriptional regulator
MTNNDSHQTRKEREEAFRRDLILDAAMTLFAEKGFDGATVADIAQASELAKGSLYQIFQSKEEIIAAIINRKIDRMSDSLSESLSINGSPTDIIRRIIANSLEDIWENRKFARIFFHEMKGFHWRGDPGLPDMVHERVFDTLKKIEQVISKGQQNGEFRSDISSATLLAALHGFLNGVIFMWLNNIESMDLENAVREVQDLFLYGAKPREGSIAS